MKSDHKFLLMPDGSDGRPSVVSATFPFSPSHLGSFTNLSISPSLGSTFSAFSTVSNFETSERATAPNFSPIQKGICLSILSECLDQLCILKRIYRIAADEEPVDKLQYRTLAERFGHSGRDLDAYKINHVTNDYHKLLKEINIFIEVMTQVRAEIQESCTFTKLTDFLETAEKMKKDEKSLVRELRRKERKVILLRRATRDEKRKNMATLEALYREINSVMTEYETLSAYLDQEHKFLEKWEKARREQNYMIMTDKEEEYLSVIKTMDKNMKDEYTCHGEITMFYEEVREDYLKQIQDWMERYETELEEKDNQIIKMKVDNDNLFEVKQNLQATYEQRNQEIEDYMEVKRLRREKEKREALENWAAEKIQAWWRGVMMRKKLGPYRQKKKKGKDKKGKKGRKK